MDNKFKPISESVVTPPSLPYHLYRHVHIDSAFIMCGNKVPLSRTFQFERQNILLVCDKRTQQRQW